MQNASPVAAWIQVDFISRVTDKVQRPERMSVTFFKSLLCFELIVVRTTFKYSEKIQNCCKFFGL